MQVFKIFSKIEYRALLIRTRHALKIKKKKKLNWQIANIEYHSIAGVKKYLKKTERPKVNLITYMGLY